MFFQLMLLFMELLFVFSTSRYFSFCCTTRRWVYCIIHESHSALTHQKDTSTFFFQTQKRLLQTNKLLFRRNVNDQATDYCDNTG